MNVKCVALVKSITQKRKEEIKRLMLENKPVPSVNRCLQQEKIKTFSERQLHTKHWMRNYNIDSNNPSS